MSAEQPGGNQVWKLSRANKLVSCPQWEKCSHAAYRAKRENGYFWATALCREGWRAASSEGNLAEPAAASEQRKLLSSWALLCPLGHNYLHSSFPNVCFDVTDKCTTWYLLVFALVPGTITLCSLCWNVTGTPPACWSCFTLPVHKREKKPDFLSAVLQEDEQNPTQVGLHFSSS